MGIISRLVSAWRNRRRQARTVPSNYLRGYRRLAATIEEADAERGHCYSCKHAVAFVGWTCERRELGCEWERCYTLDTVTPADVRAGLDAGGLVSRWVGLPKRA